MLLRCRQLGGLDSEGTKVQVQVPADQIEPSHPGGMLQDTGAPSKPRQRVEMLPSVAMPPKFGHRVSLQPRQVVHCLGVRSQDGEAKELGRLQQGIEAARHDHRLVNPSQPGT